MRTQSTDTDRQTEAAWIAMLRRATLRRKFAQVRSLSQTTLSLSKRAIARKNPYLTQGQLDVLFVRYRYGEELAERFEHYLKNRDDGKL